MWLIVYECIWSFSVTFYFCSLKGQNTFSRYIFLRIWFSFPTKLKKKLKLLIQSLGLQCLFRSWPKTDNSPPCLKINLNMKQSIFNIAVWKWFSCAVFIICNVTVWSSFVNSCFLFLFSLFIPPPSTSDNT